jgi:4-amino-4-deoxy-L-arabinose transferase-like glycosyltransferase
VEGGRCGLNVGAYGFLVAALLVGGFALRLTGIDTPSIEQRETQSGLLAREWSLDRTELPAWQQHVLDVVDEEIKPIEPPILDALAAAAFRVTDSESFWFPRLVSSLLWVVGGVFLLLVGRRITTSEGAIVALALYLAWPYGVWHSRLFMPDALLVCALLAAVWAVIRYWDAPASRRFALAAGVSAFAVLVKPGVAFLFLVALFGALALSRGELTRTLVSGRLPLFVGIAVAPAALYTFWGLYLTDFIWSGADDQRVTPELLGEGGFWRGWWNVVSFLLRFPQSQESLALVAVALGVAGLAVARRGVPRAVLWGLAVGYLAFGLAYANYTSTHPYYSLPLIPLLSLSIGVLAGYVVERSGRFARATRVALTVVVAAAVGVAAQKAHSILSEPSPGQAIAAYRRIGDLTGHTTRSIIVDRELGTPAMFWGWIVTKAWEIDYTDRPPPWIHPERADYLIVTDLAALDTHRGLRDLAARLPVVAGERLCDLRHAPRAP